ncbi:uncharacterized protein LOC131162494 [Malania oleifera]|uniref:uncharacterized protein LOC131162494 n=1 Tax=Malania oleifera TaxID=397392 RepID=UPI0025ADBF65|nr:uncharacterized protein LOC131162494 [Malania oleifera]
MIQSINPYYQSKTAEILSRYRPIAPKPAATEGPLTSPNNQSSLWNQLQLHDRPTRTRKRGKAHVCPPPLKRPRTHPLLPLSSPPPPQNLHFQGLNFLPQLNLPSPPKKETTQLSFLKPTAQRRVIDLNTVAEIPDEKDFLQQLQEPQSSNVIAPQPVRPVGSSISVGSISEDPSYPARVLKVSKKSEEVENEVESDVLPAVISDSNHRVRLANSAYKEMVGQPECSWLDSMVGGAAAACKSTRICGEVMLHLSDQKAAMMSNGFSCWVRIEWGRNDRHRNSITAFCNAVRLSCESKDYVFAWRFHTHTKEASQFNSHA